MGVFALINQSSLSDGTAFFVSPAGDDRHLGTIDQPWKTVNHAVETLQAGQAVYFREGVYRLERQARVRNSGTESAWIVIAGYPGERAVIDASDVIPGEADRPGPYRHEQGAIHLEQVKYIRIQELTVTHSHWAGICVLDSQYIDLINNTLDGSFSSGISIWDTTRQGVCHHHRVLGNTVIHATTWDMIPAGYQRGSEPPHEAISVAGANDFEVAYNHVYDCDKEGIDVKETSKRGQVHHNYVHRVDRQGLYADTWFGVLENVAFFDNVVHDCGGSGIALSVEDVEILQDISIHHNLIFNNKGTGIYVSRWGKDGPRRRIQIYNNTIHHNGYGKPNPGENYYYITGGMYLYSANLSDLEVHNNVFSDNQGFQIGYSEHYLHNDPDVTTALARRMIKIEANLLFDPHPPRYPIHIGWPGHFANAYATYGDHPLEVEPRFMDIEAGDFRLSNDESDARLAEMGAYPRGAKVEFWWKENFPPKLVEAAR
jgi:hypothetical protein